MNKIMTNICLGPFSFNQNMNNLINIINKHLLIIYKSTNVFKILLFKNKYFFYSVIILGLITFLFNKNLNYFNHFTIDHLVNINLFSIKSIIFFLVTFYLIYIKFNILIRIISLIKGISFFYKEIKLNLIKDIKIIFLYFYLFNFFFISISILFTLNLSYNIFIINSELSQLFDLTTTFFSLIILLFYLKNIINNKFIINNNEINPLKVLFIITIICTPFILLNFYSDKIINLFNDYNIFKNNNIYCDSKGDSNFNEKLKEGTNVITNNTNTTTFINSSNNSINTDTKPTSNLSEVKYNGSTSSSRTTPNIIIINNFNDLPKQVFVKMLKDFYNYKLYGFDKLSFDMLSPLNYDKIELKLNDDLIKFLNNHINKIIINNNKIEYNKIIELIIKLYKKELEFNRTIDIHVKNHHKAMEELDNLNEREYNNYVRAVNRYKQFKQSLVSSKMDYNLKFDKTFKILSSQLNKDIELEINEFKNRSKLDKILDKLKFKNKSNPNLPINDINKSLITQKSFNSSLNKSPFNNLDDLSEYSDLFYRSNESLSSSNSNIDLSTRLSNDSDRTIKQTNMKPLINEIYKLLLRIKKLMKRNIKRFFKL